MFMTRCKEIYAMIAERLSTTYAWWTGSAKPVMPPIEAKPLSAPAAAMTLADDDNDEDVDTPFDKRAYKNDILTNLDNYFKYIRHMKRADPDAYALYSRIGGQFVTQRNMNTEWTLREWRGVPPRWKTVRPAFGCILFPSDHNETEEALRDKTVPRFVYFTKLETPPADIQPMPSGYDIYKVTMLYADTDREKRETYVDVAVAVGPDNRCTALHTHHDDVITIHSKRGPAIYKGKFTVRHKRWGFHRRIEQMARELNLSPETFIVQTFGICVHLWEATQDQMVEVRATKGKITARFNITGDDTADLFRDRIKVGGKRIFHSVRPHLRKSGKAVKMHFRGQRQFIWKSYAIDITVPGRDHMWLADFDVGAHDAERINHQDTVSTKKLGKILKKQTTIAPRLH